MTSPWRTRCSYDGMPLDSRTIAGEIDPRLEIVGVAATHGGSDRVELLVSVATDGNDESRVHMLNLTRAAKVDFERDLRHQLRDTLAESDPA